MRRTIYQFDDPQAAARGEDETRWVAARTAEQARAHAQAQGWRNPFGEDVVVLFPEISATRDQFESMGCDAVLSDTEATNGNS